jgi:hypothetical protein
MVLAMVRRPPQNTFLAGSLSQERHQELRHPPEPVASVTEIAVISTRHSEHPN